MNEKLTLVGKQKKESDIVSDFSKEESEQIMLSLASSLKKTLGEVHEEHVKEEERLKQISIKNKDGSVSANIEHIAMDPFGEKHAEIRTVLSIYPNDYSKIKEAVDEINIDLSLAG